MLPDIKFTYEISFGNLIATLSFLLAIWRLSFIYDSVMILLAEHRLLVNDYAERKEIKPDAVSTMAVAEAMVAKARRKSEKSVRGNGGWKW